MVVAQKTGISTTKGFVSLAFIIATFITEEAKGDGLQITDVGKLLMNSDFRSKVVSAISNIDLIDDEIMDLDRSEIFEIVQFVLQKTKEFVTGSAA